MDFAAGVPDRALSPSIVRAARVCQEKGLTKYRWSCSKFPEINPKFDDHLLAQTSRPGRERWLCPENVVGTKAWMSKTGKHQQGRKWLAQYQEFTGHLSDSWNMHPNTNLPCRDAFITGSAQGAISGTPSQLDPPLLGYQPKGYAQWVQGGGERWTPAKKNVPRVVGPREFNRTSQASLLATSQGKNAKEARKSVRAKLDATQPKSLASTMNRSRASTMDRTGGFEGSGALSSPKSMASTGTFNSGSQSMPTLALGPYPPTPAYVRHFMKQIDLEKPDI